MAGEFDKFVRSSYGLNPGKTIDDYSGLAPKDLLKDPRFLNDVYDYYNKRDGKEFNTHAEAAEYFFNDRAWRNVNTMSIASDVVNAYTDSDEQNSRLARLQKAYQAYPDFWEEGGRGAGHFFKNLVPAAILDPVNVVGFGSGAVAGRVAARVAAAKTMAETGKVIGRGEAMGIAAKRGAFVGARNEGLVNAGIEGTADTLLQDRDIELGLQDEYSLGRTAVSAGAGAALGGALGGMFGAAGGAWKSKAGIADGMDDTMLMRNAASEDAARAELRAADEQAKAATEEADGPVATEERLLSALDDLEEAVRNEMSVHIDSDLTVKDPEAIDDLARHQVILQKLRAWPQRKSELSAMVDELVADTSIKSERSADSIRKEINIKDALFAKLATAKDEAELNDIVGKVGERWEAVDAAADASKVDATNTTAAATTESAPPAKTEDPTVEAAKTEDPVKTESNVVDQIPEQDTQPVVLKFTKPAVRKHVIEDLGFSSQEVDAELGALSIKGASRAQREAMLSEFVLRKTRQADAGGGFAEIRDALGAEHVVDDDVFNSYIDTQPHLAGYKEDLNVLREQFIDDNAGAFYMDVFERVGGGDPGDVLELVGETYGPRVVEALKRSAAEYTPKKQAMALKNGAFSDEALSGITNEQKVDIGNRAEAFRASLQANLPGAKPGFIALEVRKYYAGLVNEARTRNRASSDSLARSGFDNPVVDSEQIFDEVVSGRVIERQIDLNTKVLGKEQSFLRKGRRFISFDKEGKVQVDPKTGEVVEYSITQGRGIVNTSKKRVAQTKEEMERRALERGKKLTPEQEKEWFQKVIVENRGKGPGEYESYTPTRVTLPDPADGVEVTAPYQSLVESLDYPTIRERPLADTDVVGPNGEIKVHAGVDSKGKLIDATALEMEKGSVGKDRFFNEEGHEITVPTDGDMIGAKVVERGGRKYVRTPTTFVTIDGFKPKAGESVWVDPDTGFTYYDKQFIGMKPDEVVAEKRFQAEERLRNASVKQAAADLKKTGDKESFAKRVRTSDVTQAKATTPKPKKAAAPKAAEPKVETPKAEAAPVEPGMATHTFSDGDPVPDGYVVAIRNIGDSSRRIGDVFNIGPNQEKKGGIFSAKTLLGSKNAGHWEEGYVPRGTVSGGANARKVFVPKGATPESIAPTKPVSIDALKGIQIPDNLLDAATKEKTGLHTAADLWDGIIKTEAQTWPSDSGRVALVVEDLIRGYEMFDKLVPQGVALPYATRTSAVARVNEIFGKADPNTVTLAMDFLRRLGGNPLRAPVIKAADVESPSFTAPLSATSAGLRNVVDLGTTRGDTTKLGVPEVMKLYHETAHWAYFNILSAQDRIDFWRHVKSTHYQNGRLTIPEGPYGTAPKGGNTSPSELFANEFTRWMQQEGRMPGGEDLWKRMVNVVKNVIQKFFYGDPVDPELAKLFNKILPERAERRNILATVNPKTDAGKYLAKTISEIESRRWTLEDAMGTESIDSMAQQLAEINRILFTNRKVGLATRGDATTRQTWMQIDKLRREIYDDMGETLEKGEIDWDRVASDEDYLPQNAEDSIAYEMKIYDIANRVVAAMNKYERALGRQWEKFEGTPVVTDRETFMRKANYGQGHRNIARARKNKRLAVKEAQRAGNSAVQAAVKNDVKLPRPKDVEPKAKPTADNIKTLSANDLVAEIKRVGSKSDRGRDALVELSRKYRAEPHVERPSFQIADDIIFAPNVKALRDMLGDAIDSIDGNRVVSVAYTLYKRYGVAPVELKQRMVIDAVARETADSHGIGTMDGVPANARGDVVELLSKLTHREPETQATLRTLGYRMLNVMGKTLRNEVGKVEVLDTTDLYRLLGKDAPSESVSGSFVDLSSTEFGELRGKLRRIAIGLTSGRATPMTIMHEVGHLASMILMRDADRAAIADRFAQADDPIKDLILKTYPNADPLRQAYEWFAEGWAQHAAGRIAKGDIMKARLGGAEGEAALEMRGAPSRLIDTVTEVASYLVNGLIGNNDIRQMYRRMTFYGDMFAPSKGSEAINFVDHADVNPALSGIYASSVEKSMSRNKIDLIRRFVGAEEGDPLSAYLFFHGTPYGEAFDDPSVMIRPSAATASRGPGVYLSDQSALARRYSKHGSREGILNAVRASTNDPKKIAAGREAADALWGEQGIYDQMHTHADAIAHIERRARQHGQVDVGRRAINMMSEPAADTIFSLGDYDPALQVARHKRAIRELQDQEAATWEFLEAETGLRRRPRTLPLFVRVKNTFDFGTETTYSLDGREGTQDVSHFLYDLIEEGVDEGKLADAIDLLGDTFDGDTLYDALTGVALSDGSLDGAVEARQLLADHLKDMGYDSIRIVEPVKSGDRNAYENVAALVVFDSKNLKHPQAKLFDEGIDGIFHSEIPNQPKLSASLFDAMANGGLKTDANGVQRLAINLEKQGVPSGLANAMKKIMRGDAITAKDEKNLRGGGAFLQIRENSRRLHKAGAKFVSDFIAPTEEGLLERTGVGFFERHQAEIGDRVMPVIEALHALPNAEGPFKRWVNRNKFWGEIPASVESVRIAKAVRRGDASSLSAKETEVYDKVRDLLANERALLNKHGAYVGEVENYLPVVYDVAKINDDPNAAAKAFADYFHRESRRPGSERNPISYEEAEQRAIKLVAKIISDDGVILPHDGGRRGVISDHLDHSRVIRAEGEDLVALEKFMVNDLSSILMKYFDASVRKRMFLEKFGANDHGYHAYRDVIAGGKDSVVRLLTTGKVYVRKTKLPTDDGVELVGREYDLFDPLTKDIRLASKLADQVIALVKNDPKTGVSAAKRVLMSEFQGRPEWAVREFGKRVDGIVNALADFANRDMDANDFKFMDEAMNVMQRKPIHSTAGYDHAMNISRGLRTFSSVTLLPYTMLTSIPDIALPLIRSGNLSAWAKGWKRWGTDPEYRRAARAIGLSIESMLHDKLAHMYGAEGGRFNNAFFNATGLSPWTNMNREVAGLVAYESFRTEAMKAQKLAMSGQTQSARYKEAVRYLKHFGLEGYAEPGRNIADAKNFASDPAIRWAAIKFANESIFAPNVNDIPLWAQTPWGAVVAQLKSFPLMMGRMSKTVMDEARQGNIKPLVALLSAGAGFGALSLGVKDVAQMRGGEDERTAGTRDRRISKAAEEVGVDLSWLPEGADKFLGWYAEGLAQAGGFGLFAELLYNTASQVDNGAWGKVRVATSIAGPSSSLPFIALDAAAGGLAALSDDDTNSKQRTAVRSLASRIPGVGGNRAAREGITDFVAGEKVEPSSKDDGGFSDKAFGGDGFSDKGFK